MVSLIMGQAYSGLAGELSWAVWSTAAGLPLPRPGCVMEKIVVKPEE
jgi:hypothetical protein